VAAALVAVGANVVAGCGSDASSGSKDGTGGQGASGAVTPGSGGATPGAGGATIPGAGGTAPGTGGSAKGGGGPSGGANQCPPECFVANECVTACGQTPQSYGCCPCPAGMINARSCSQTMDAGSGPVSCDPRKVLCRRAAPTCPQGQLPSVDGSCYGPCVPADSCVCGSAAECPDPDHYICHMSQMRCGPYV
jgi:hypothetical protein